MSNHEHTERAAGSPPANYPPIGRRRFLAAAGGSAFVAALLAACGRDDDGAGTATTAGSSGSGNSSQSRFASLTWPTRRRGRKILDQNGKPWMIRGQALWSLATLSQEDQFFVIDSMFEHGHNCMMVTVTESFYSNNDPPTENFYGEEPFVGNWYGSALNTAYWDRWIETVDYAATKGISIMCVIAYCGFSDGDGAGDFIVARTTTECEQYGEDIATLHLSHPNIMFMVAGDRNFSPDSDLGVRYNAMINGLRAADPSCLIFAHTGSDISAVAQFGTGYDIDFLAANHVYTFDGGGVDDAAAEWASSDLPLYFIEGAYWHGEDEPDQLFRSQFWMGCIWGLGCFDGHVSLWSFGSDPAGLEWHDNLTSPEMDFTKVCYDFFATVDWGQTLPDFDANLLTTGEGTGTNRASVCFGRSVGILYFPNSRSITCDLSLFAGEAVNCRWFDPTSAQYTDIGEFPPTAGRRFTHPGNNDAGDGDWVLLLDSSGGQCSC